MAHLLEAAEVSRLCLCVDQSLSKFILEQGTCVNPKLVVNKPIVDMSPEFDREELAREMVIEMWMMVRCRSDLLRGVYKIINEECNEHLPENNSKIKKEINAGNGCF